MITAEKQYSVSRPHAPNIEGNNSRLVAHKRYRGIRHLLGLRLQLGIAHHLADLLKIDAALAMQAKPGFRFQNLAYRVVQALAADLTAVDCLEQRVDKPHPGSENRAGRQRQPGMRVELRRQPSILRLIRPWSTNP